MGTNSSGYKLYGHSVSLDIPCSDVAVIGELIKDFEDTRHIKIDIVSDKVIDGGRIVTIKSESFTPNMIFDLAYKYKTLCHLSNKGKL